MAKFKVGDRVKHRSSVTGSVADVLPSGNYYVRLDRPAFPGDDCMWPFDERELSPLTPAIPDGWTSADEPPDGIRDMRVMLKSGKERLGWYSESAILPSCGKWYLYPEGTTPKSIDDDGTSFDDTPAAPGEVLAWREIEPAAKARYVVCVIHTEHDTLEEAELHALRAMESLRVNVVIARVVEEVKPGKPVITKLEE